MTVQPHNVKAQSVWNAPAGRHDEISRSIADAIEHAVERVQDDIATAVKRFRWRRRGRALRRAATNLDDHRRAELRQAMIAWHETFPSPLGYDQPRQYVITRGIRR